MTTVEARLRRAYFQGGWLGLLTNPNHIIRQALHSAIAGYAPQIKGKVLDVGCGAKPYRHLFGHVDRYDGMDVPVSGHNHRASTIDILYDGRRFPVPSGSYDAAVSFEVLEHVFNVDEHLAEVRRVLRPRALYLLSTPLIWGEHEAPYDFGRYTSFGLASLLNRHGFDILAQSKTGGGWLTACQIFSSYVNRALLPRDRGANIVATALLLFPFHCIAYALAWVLPRGDALYLNNVVLCRRRD